MSLLAPILRLVAGRKRVNSEHLAELERADRLARAQAEIDYHLAVIYRCRNVAYEELDRMNRAPGDAS